MGLRRCFVTAVKLEMHGPGRGGDAALLIVLKYPLASGGAQCRKVTAAQPFTNPVHTHFEQRAVGLKRNEHKDTNTYLSGESASLSSVLQPRSSLRLPLSAATT